MNTILRKLFLKHGQGPVHQWLLIQCHYTASSFLKQQPCRALFWPWQCCSTKVWSTAFSCLTCDWLHNTQQHSLPRKAFCRPDLMLSVLLILAKLCSSNYTSFLFHHTIQREDSLYTLLPLYLQPLISRFSTRQVLT